MTSEPPVAASDFELFDVAPRFAQDRAVLDARWKALQGQVHPDRFATGGAAAQQAATRWTIRINEAYRRLRDPLAQAAYLCELHGQGIHAETSTTMPAAFLMQQVGWRESLDHARSARDVEALAGEVAIEQRILLDELATLIDERCDWPAAAAQVRMLMFVARFAQDVDGRIEAL